MECPGFGVEDENHLKSLLFFTSPLQWVVLVLVVVFCEKKISVFPLLLAPTDLLDTSWGVFFGVWGLCQFYPDLSREITFSFQDLVLIIGSKEKTRARIS